MVGKEWGPSAGRAVTLSLTAGGLDRFGRPADLHYQHDRTTIHRYQYGCDNAGNRQFARLEQRGHDNDRSWLYGYDRLNRLTLAECGHLNAGNDGFTLGPVTPKAQAWKLDLLGNWSGGGENLDSLQRFADGDGQYDPEQGDALLLQDHHAVNAVNAITQRMVSLFSVPPLGWLADFSHDAAGSVTNDGHYTYTYDAWNRVVEVRHPSTQHLIAFYRYDALGRRINKVVDNSGGLDTTDDGDFFYYDGNRVIVHQHNPATGDPVQREYVFGQEYIDEAVAQYDTVGTGSPVLYYLLIDANYNVVAMVASDGDLYEQYRYWPYGTVLAADEDHDGNGTIAPIADLKTLATNLGHQGLCHDRAVTGRAGAAARAASAVGARNQRWATRW
ncbi:MAG TPA: hypothetical protein PKK06_17250 [Phycisphaerae bacterium]|nr:hypothetical protein [Phycisphaerae bacterium]HNU46954.1 hypothetical protein [Phycisphaerae bacterium]